MEKKVFCDLVTPNENWRPWNKENEYERSSLRFDSFEEARDYAVQQISRAFRELSLYNDDYEAEQWNTETTYFIAITRGPRIVIQYEIYPYEFEEYDDLPF